MKKRVVALLLSLVLVICAVPFAFAEDETEFVPEPSFYVSEESRLTGMGYYDLHDGDEIAVGDELWVSYFDSIPAEVLVNGETVHRFGVWDMENYVYTVKATGTLTLVVRRGDELLFSRSYNVISSADMYKKNVRDMFAEIASIRLKDFFPPISELKDAAMHGFPVGNPFLPAAFLAMMTFNVFSTLFSFVKIVR